MFHQKDIEGFKHLDITEEKTCIQEIDKRDTTSIQGMKKEVGLVIETLDNKRAIAIIFFIGSNGNMDTKIVIEIVETEIDIETEIVKEEKETEEITIIVDIRSNRVIYLLTKAIWQVTVVIC